MTEDGTLYTATQTHIGIGFYIRCLLLLPAGVNLHTAGIRKYFIGKVCVFLYIVQRNVVLCFLIALHCVKNTVIHRVLHTVYRIGRSIEGCPDNLRWCGI